jgi:hypothetical protein
LPDRFFIFSQNASEAVSGILCFLVSS